MSRHCVTRLRALANPAMRLFLFHSAGASHLLYRGWESAFPADWELCAVEAPGRGRLADLPPATSSEQLGTFILPAMTPWLDGPFALFGHSMGGLVAYSMTFRLARAGLPLPAWVGISARRVPGALPGAPAILNHALPDAELRRVVVALGGTTQGTVDDPRLWAIMAPVLRADLRIGDTWQQPTAPPFTMPPLSAFAGSTDTFAPPQLLEAWRGRTSRFLGLHVFPGGHFYLNDCRAELSQRIVADIAAARAPINHADKLPG